MLPMISLYICVNQAGQNGIVDEDSAWHKESVSARSGVDETGLSVSSCLRAINDMMQARQVWIDRVLSYRHAYHAGNHADVLKHTVLIYCLKYLMRKDKPLMYFDTHAGPGSYDLMSDQALNNTEHEWGIARFSHEQSWCPPIQDLVDRVSSLNTHDSMRFYPGSARIAVDLLRPGDRAELCELHPSDHERLAAQFQQNKMVTVYRQDGYARAIKSMPPQSRRGLLLMDPSYELKSDYKDSIKCLKALHRKFATGIYILWYPVVDRDRVKQMELSFSRSGIHDIVQLELNPMAESAGRGMTGSGLFVINPPWTLVDDMTPVLNQMLERLSQQSGHNGVLIKQLVGESSDTPKT